MRSMLFRKNENKNMEMDTLDMELSELESMLSYQNIYFSKNSFVKRIYVGENGLFLVIPLVDDEFGKNEKMRCRKVMRDIREELGLNLYLYPIFVGEEKIYYSFDVSELVELGCSLDFFLEQLYEYTSENRTDPKKVEENMTVVLSYESTKKKKICVLDENILEHIFTVLSFLEDNDKPLDDVRYDEDGTEYILRDTDIMIGHINTGLVGKKEWFRVSDMDSDKLALCTVFAGSIGLHKFMTGEIMQGFAYLLTSGFGGILPALDILSMFFGTYSYNEVSYYQNEDGITREKEKVYMRKNKGILKGILYITVSLIIGFLVTYFIYSKVLEEIIQLFVEVGLEFTKKQGS